MSQTLKSDQIIRLDNSGINDLNDLCIVITASPWKFSRFFGLSTKIIKSVWMLCGAIFDKNNDCEAFTNRYECQDIKFEKDSQYANNDSNYSSLTISLELNKLRNKFNKIVFSCAYTEHNNNAFKTGTSYILPSYFQIRLYKGLKSSSENLLGSFEIPNYTFEILKKDTSISSKNFLNVLGYLTLNSANIEFACIGKHLPTNSFGCSEILDTREYYELIGSLDVFDAWKAKEEKERIEELARKKQKKLEKKEKKKLKEK